MKKFIKVVLKGYWWITVAGWLLVTCGQAAESRCTYPDDSVYETACKIVDSAMRKLKIFFRH